MDKLFESFLFPLILWNICVLFVSVVEPDTEYVAWGSKDKFQATHAISSWVPPATTSTLNETATQIDADRKATIDSGEDIYAIEDHT